MIEKNKIWAISWRYLDNSSWGILDDIAYENWNTADHIARTLRNEVTDKDYTVVELGVVRGELK